MNESPIMRDLEGEVAELFAELFEEALIDLEELIEELQAYREELLEDISQSDFADGDLAATLSARLLELLERAAQSYDEDDHRHAQAALRYFMESADGDHDMDSPAGFDDDREVFNAVATRLGHDDLVIGF